MPTIDLDDATFRSVSLNHLEDLHLVGHHCTRAIDVEIRSTGLRILDVDEQINHVAEKLRLYGIECSQITGFKRSVRDYLSPLQVDGRNSKIWFCLNRSLFEVDDGCESFFQFYGGESIYRAFERLGDDNEIKKALMKIGEPLVVTAQVPFIAIPSFQQDRILAVLKGKSSQTCEAYANRPIGPDSILSITPWHGRARPGKAAKCP